MKNNKSQKNTPSLGGLFFKSNRDLIKYIKPTWYGNEKRIGPTGALTEGDYNRVESRINTQEESDQKTNKNDPGEALNNAQYLAEQTQDEREQWANRRDRAKTGKYTTDAYRRAARQANFGSAEEAKFLQRQAESLPRVKRRFDGGYSSAKERAEDDVWTRMANARRDDPKDEAVVSGAKLINPDLYIDEAKESLRGENQKEAYDRLTDRVRAAQAQSAKDDAERDKEDPNARKRFDASMKPVEKQVTRETKLRNDIIQDEPFRRLNSAVNAANRQQPASRPAPANSADPAVRPAVQPDPAVQTAPENASRPPLSLNRMTLNPIPPRPVVQPDPAVQTAPETASRPPLSLNRMTLNPIRRLTNPIIPLNDDNDDDTDDVSAPKDPKDPKKGVWAAGAEGLKKLKNKVLGRSMLHVDRDTMRLNKAVNNAFRKSKKKI